MCFMIPKRITCTEHGGKLKEESKRNQHEISLIASKELAVSQKRINGYLSHRVDVVCSDTSMSRCEEMLKIRIIRCKNMKLLCLASWC